MTELDPERWLERYGDLLFRYALARVGDNAVAEDLVQETLLAAWRGRAEFAGRSSESSWLVGILRHKIADHFRKFSSSSLEELGLDWDAFDEFGHWREAPKDLGDPERDLELDQLKAALLRCLEKLPPRLRHLFYLREVEGLRAEEICRQLPASSTNNVWVMLSRMRFRLRRCLEQAGFGGKD
ncbi:sigma-70 family RNA polymerase sigma factor [Methylothermus subterraneus]